MVSIAYGISTAFAFPLTLSGIGLAANTSPSEIAAVGGEGSLGGGGAAGRGSGAPTIGFIFWRLIFEDEATALGGRVGC